MCQISMVWLIICWVGSVKSQAMHKRVRGCRMLIASDSNALFLYSVSINNKTLAHLKCVEISKEP